MILGEPDLKSIIDLILEEGCPRCGELPGGISVNGPDEIVLEGCGHVVDATRWIETQ